MPTAVAGKFPYDLANLLGGAVRVLLAPISATKPATAEDIFATKTPYAPEDPWFNVGATEGATSMTRNFSTNEWKIEQTNLTVVEDVDEVTRQITVPMAEITPELLQIIENAPSIATVAAVSGTNVEQKKVAFGNFTDLEQYRIAFVSLRKKVSGQVLETAGGLARGRFFVGVGYRVQIAADASELQQQKGQLTSRSVTMKFYPEPGEPEGQEHGTFIDEQAGTIGP